MLNKFTVASRDFKQPSQDEVMGTSDLSPPGQGQARKVSDRIIFLEIGKVSGGGVQHGEMGRGGVGVEKLW